MPRIRILSVLFVLCTTLMSLTYAWPKSLVSADNSTNAREVVRTAQKTYLENTRALLDKTKSSNCTYDTARVRKAWDDLTTQEREDYIKAVKCLNNITPARTPKRIVPGARTWLDDFVYAHINQTDFIHVSGLLLPWHRQFVHAYEQTLRESCHFSGAVPYWPWERHSANQSLSPVFQAGNDSFGGNGLYVPHEATNGSLPGLPADDPVFISRPAGSGGGSIQDGAFKDSIVNLGPVFPANNTKNNTYGTHYNPRNLKRDFLQQVSTDTLTYESIAALLQLNSIHEFHPQLEFGIHPASHSFVGGDANDFFSSPNDPVFFLIHSQIDRVWTIWQGQDYKSRATGLDGTTTLFNDPPSKNATLNTIMKMGIPAGGDIPVRSAMSAVSGEYCYIYM